MKATEEKIKEILERGVEEVIQKEHLEDALHSEKKLVIKFGIDPTSPDLHLGHMVPLRKLRQFQDAGHTIALVIGDFTASVGDPSGRSEERKELSKKEIEHNFKKYLKLAGKIIDIKKSKIFYNSLWFEKRGSVEKIIQISRASTYQQIMKRADFQKRVRGGGDITLLEMLYPLFQGYDSVEVKSNVEIGGTDQKFNLLMGRRIQRHFGVPEQDIITVPILEGTDGIRKMSKSYNNYISLDESLENIYSKILSIPDDLVKKYLLLITDVRENNKVFSEPVLEQKKKLAFEIISQLYSKEKALHSGEAKVVYTKKGESWVDFLIHQKFIKSKGEAKRLITGGGIDFNGAKIKNHKDKITKEGEAKIGKYKFVNIKIK